MGHMTTPQLLSRTRQHPWKAHAQYLPSCHRERSRYVIVLLSLYFPPHQDERHCITNGVWSAWAGNVARLSFPQMLSHCFCLILCRPTAHNSSLERKIMSVD